MSKDERPRDFEYQWQGKLSRAIEEISGKQTRDRVLSGGETLSDGSTPHQKLVWTCQALNLMAESMDQRARQEILTACHCQYPVEDLQEIKAHYQEHGDIDAVLTALQVKFESFLRETLELEEQLVDVIRSKGWGLAGIRQGQTIIATKIPKSGYLREYFSEEDPLQKRRYYCHCPRVRDELGNDPTLPKEYCYCGAGYYQGIWEEILSQPVKVELKKSVMQGDDVCTVAIHLP